MPARMASWFVGSVIGWPSSRISPASGRVMPNSDKASSVRPAPSSPVRPSTSPRCRVKSTSAYSPARVRPRTSSNGGGAGQVAGGDGVLDGQPGHQLADAPRVDLGHRPGADLAAVAHHRDALGDLDHLVEPMADEHHRDAVGLQLRHDAQQRVDLGPGERGRGLVHEQQPGVGGEAAADRDHLPLGDRQRGHAGVQLQMRTRAAPAARRPPGASGHAARDGRARRGSGRWRCSRPPTGSGTATGPGR